jgi:plastocyanin
MLISIIVLIVVLIGAYFIFQMEKNTGGEAETIKTEIIFENPKKTPHWEYNVPTHESIMAAVPINVVLGFNFDLGPGTSMSIKREGVEYGTGETEIEDNKLIMRRQMDLNSPDGIYKVDYNACWPDGSCHTGFFQFEIDRAQSSSFINLKDNQEVMVDLKEISFNPDKIIISKGTKVTWINKDALTHYINSNPHGGHSYFPEQNSEALEEGDSFSLIFDQPGIYPYHCSVHHDMKGSIIVEE